MRKIAFLVGNDTFPKDPSIPPLRFTQNDARELAAVLEDPETCGFETRLYLNRPSQEVLIDLNLISEELQQDDTLLFYSAAHGKPIVARVNGRSESNTLLSKPVAKPSSAT